jgi:hypothetical protein
MKPRRKEWRQILVLTVGEKRTLSFVVAAFILGVTTKHYRAKHSVPPAHLAIHEVAKIAGLPAQKRAEAKHRKVAP